MPVNLEETLNADTMWNHIDRVIEEWWRNQPQYNYSVPSKYFTISYNTLEEPSIEDVEFD